MMIRDKYACWIFGVYMLSNHKNRDIIAQFLRQIKTWRCYSWNL